MCSQGFKNFDDNIPQIFQNIKKWSNPEKLRTTEAKKKVLEHWCWTDRISILLQPGAMFPQGPSWRAGSGVGCDWYGSPMAPPSGHNPRTVPQLTFDNGYNFGGNVTTTK